MLWVDYTIDQLPDGSFSVRGDWPGEVMGIKKDGTQKETCLYRPGDVFVVDENGVLRKADGLKKLLDQVSWT